MSLFIGLDLGTSRAKALVCDERGKVLATRSATSYSTSSPRPRYAEQEPHQWWETVLGLLSEVIQENPVDRSEIEAIGLTGQMHGPVFLNKEGDPLGPCMIWSDTRAEEETDLIQEKIPGVTEITGNPPAPGYSAPKLLWFRKHARDLYDRIWKILLPKDFINYRLTGQVVTDPSDASGTLLYDLRRKSWSDQILNKLEVSKTILPPVLNSTRISGGLRSEISSRLGLPRGLSVVVGGGDLATGLIGNGGVRKGVAAVTIGTAGQVLVPDTELREDLLGQLFAFQQAGQEGLFSLGTVPAGGYSLEWFKDSVSRVENCLAGDVDPYSLLTDQAREVPIGARGLIFLPYLMGSGTPHINYQARGSFVGLTSDHGKGEMIRAIMEGVTLGLRESLETTERAGGEISEIRLGAGATRSSIWNEIQADVYGQPVHLVRVSDPSPLGAALLAGVATGSFSDLEQATEQSVEISSRIEPNPAASRRYEEIFGAFQDLYSSLEKFFPQLQAWE
ncbi:MAG: xylulokinase [Candidatus Acetothermia bacterium]